MPLLQCSDIQANEQSMNAHNKLGASILICAALGAPIAAIADTVVTYDFTGTVIGASGIYSSAGTSVTGTYTIDVGAGFPSQSTLPVSFTSIWASLAYGGTNYGTTAPSALVFASTLMSGGVSYSNSTPSSVGSNSFVEGFPESGTVPNGYAGGDTESPDSTDSVYSSFELIGGTGTSAPFDANGLPIFANASSGTGVLNSSVAGSTGTLAYTISSLTPASPVPLPAALPLLLFGLGGLGALVRRNRMA